YEIFACLEFRRVLYRSSAGRTSSSMFWQCRGIPLIISIHISQMIICMPRHCQNLELEVRQAEGVTVFQCVGDLRYALRGGAMNRHRKTGQEIINPVCVIPMVMCDDDTGQL